MYMLFIDPLCFSCVIVCEDHEGIPYTISSISHDHTVTSYNTNWPAGQDTKNASRYRNVKIVLKLYAQFKIS